MALVDGNKLPRLAWPAQAVVRGDGRSLSIAAASIVAKVTRDRAMAALARDYPGYGWERNQGYGTPEHRAGIARLGVTPLHRRSFRPIRDALSQAS
jgi:ribonuclease HII